MTGDMSYLINVPCELETVCLLLSLGVVLYNCQSVSFGSCCCLGLLYACWFSVYLFYLIMVCCLLLHSVLPGFAFCARKLCYKVHTNSGMLHHLGKLTPLSHLMSLTSWGWLFLYKSTLSDSNIPIIAF